MAVRVEFSLEQDLMQLPASTTAVVRIINNTDRPIMTINEARGAAVLRAVDSLTGREVGEQPAPAPPGTTASPTIGPREELEERFLLSERLQLQAAAVVHVSAHVAWQSGEAESEPVYLEITTASPGFLRLATTSGGPAGHVYCAWLQAAEAGEELWLSLLSGVETAGFLSTIHCGNVVRTGALALSIPAAGGAYSQYIGWVRENVLSYARNQSGRVSIHELELSELSEPGRRIIDPILEIPYEPGVPRHAEALLVSEAPDGYQLQVARLGLEEPLRDPVHVEGDAPIWARTGYREDGSRSTLLLGPYPGEDGEPRVAVALTHWAAGRLPPNPTRVDDWSGELLAADLRRGADSALVGAALLRTGREPETYALRRFEVGTGMTGEAALPIGLEFGEAIEEAVIRVDPFGLPHALLRGTPSSPWRYWVESAGLRPLPDVIAGAPAPIDLHFLDRVHPTFVYTDPVRGLTAWCEVSRPPGLA